MPKREQGDRASMMGDERRERKERRCRSVGRWLERRSSGALLRCVALRWTLCVLWQSSGSGPGESALGVSGLAPGCLLLDSQSRFGLGEPRTDETDDRKAGGEERQVANGRDSPDWLVFLCEVSVT
ncbi:hypothetical protein BDZ90DRAFT_61286 [Jaminaea rosea]|uniref:Uncharacterized protein n=1 Tax=Jaminaea rosea TaxID=1569628 RepID=A0A316UKA4_9BASI|nr:hypothetical protein BDZ90DRAFT_61286 [Jaminaea rosea]PWN25732.1 hypothetical protein BDZ90DRAFT_61286 [Jaminaea rosea]